MHRFALVVLVLLSSIRGQSLVKDINTAAIPQGESAPGHLATLGSITLFAATTSAGRELWRTDGTAAGTVLVRDLWPGFDAAGTPYSSNPHSFVVSGSLLFFLATNAEVGDQIWKSDGTTAGTVPVRPDAPTVPANLTAFGANQVVMSIRNTLWITDGSAVGTVQIATFTTNALWPESFHAYGNRVVFAANGDSAGMELWITDGTSAGTQRVADLNPGPGSSNPRGFAEFSGWIYFTADDGVAPTQWRSDGSAAGTQRLSAVQPAYEGALLGTFHVVGGQVLYARNDGVHGVEIWKGDGTLSGSSLVKDLRAGPESCVFDNMAVLGTQLLFLGYTDTDGASLFKSDGTAAGTGLVSRSGPGSELVPFAGGVVYAGDHAVQRIQTVFFSDGTSAGTVPLSQVILTSPQEQSNGRYFAKLGNRLLFQATQINQLKMFKELFVTDGTAAGTQLLRDIYGPGETLSANPVLHGSYQGRHYFTAATASTEALWMSDGTAAGTVSICACSPPRFVTQLGNEYLFGMKDPTYGDELFKLDAQGLPQLVFDIFPGADSVPGPFAVVAGGLVFPAADYVSGRELWITDGTAAGTVLLEDINPGQAASDVASFTALGGTVFFTANDGVSGVELWSTDGTSAKTVLVRDIRVGAGSSSPQGLAIVNGKLVFTADDGIVGRELWVSDGTASGTVLLKDIRPGASASVIARMTSRGADAFFSATDGVLGAELWRTDGTAAGTYLVKDLRPGSLSAIPTSLVLVGSKLFFLADDGVHGRELCVSDGTAAGTFLLADIVPGVKPAPVTSMVAAGTVLFFVANDGQYGEEPWVSDGTSAGTRLVRDVYPDQYGSSPSSYLVVGDARVLFAATDPAFGRELWVSDGTPVGTLRLADIAPGTQSSSPSQLVRLGTQLLFTANDSLSGVELWSMPFFFAAEASARSYGSGCAQARMDVPTLFARGVPRLGSQEFELLASRLPKDGQVALGIAPGPARVELGAGCTLLLGAPIEFWPIRWLGGTSVTSAVPIPWSKSLLGTRLHFQVYARGEQGGALSAGLEAVIGS